MPEAPARRRFGWPRVRDRTTGEPLVGIEEKPVPREP
jgi:hypothetical protein